MNTRAQAKADRLLKLFSQPHFSKPPGRVKTPGDLPEVPVIALTKPRPSVAREMLYDLIKTFGTLHTCRFLGFHFQANVEIGSDRTLDRILSASNARTIWLVWSLSFCPSNLSHVFHLTTWGVFNDEYKGHTADIHRAGYEKNLRKKLCSVQKKKKSSMKIGEKITTTRKARLSKLPLSLRSLAPWNPARKEALAEVSKRERKKAAAAKQYAKHWGKAKEKFGDKQRRRVTATITPVSMPDTGGVGSMKTT